MELWQSAARGAGALGFFVVLVATARAQCLDWSSDFGLPGVDGAALASIVYDDGLGGGPSLVVGGEFSSADGTVARGVARWDGSAWSALGAGLGGAARAFALHDDGSGKALYVGGSFTTAGGVPAVGIARWDGVTWSPVGGGITGTVLSLAVYDDGQGGGPQLYAGGLFTLADGQPARKLARYDGTSWHEVGGGIPGVNSAVRDLLVHDDGSGRALFVGGSFSQVGATAAANVARWNGIGWSVLGAGVNGAVTALAVYDAGGGRELFAGGEFSAAGGAGASRIARWNGAAWSPLGAGVNDTVRALGVHDDGAGRALIVAGQFTSAGGAPERGIARWTQSGWSSLGNGFLGFFTPSVRTVCTLALAPPSPPLLFAGGSFSGAAAAGTANVAAWDGASWSPLGDGQGLSESQGYSGAGARAFAEYDDGLGGGLALYVAGGFVAAGSAYSNGNGLARWEGSSWSALPAIPFADFVPISLGLFDPGSGPRLYVGWNFGVAAWNGTAWDPGQSFALHGSLGGAQALAVHDDGGGNALYVGGAFTSGCFLGIANVLRWDGASCSAVGSLGPVNALLEHDDGSGPALYAAGTTALFPPYSGYVARWDGAQWIHLGGGMDDAVHALAVFDGGSGPELYAGGRFQLADGMPAAGIARWNGTSWNPVGLTAPLLGVVYALTVHDGGGGAAPALYAAGRFREIGQVPVLSIARWDGASWSALGVGIVDSDDLTQDVRSLFSFDDGSGPRLWAGGSFRFAGGRPSVGIARWGESCGCTGTTYCTAKTSSAGCVPSMQAIGTTSLGDPAPFALIATPMQSSSPGLLFYGKNGAAAQPFVGGTLCVRQPVTRTAVQSSGGNPPPSDCSGGFAFDFKAHALSGVDPGLAPGITVNAQYWYRDPADPFGSGTTDAVVFTLCP